MLKEDYEEILNEVRRLREGWVVWEIKTMSGVICRKLTEISNMKKYIL